MTYKKVTAWPTVPLLLVAISTWGLITPLVAQQVDLFGGFDPRKVPVEMQAWWVPNFGHIHAAARVPLGQEVSGILEFEVRIVLHNNPSHLYELRIDTDEGVFKRIPLDLDCPFDGEGDNNCAFTVPVSLNTRDMRDGWREIRIRATTKTPDKQKFLNSSGVQIFVNNGGSRKDYKRAIDNRGLIGRGWYGKFGYTNAWIGNVPTDKISGEYTFMVRAQKKSQHLTVALDKTHHIPAVGSWPEQEQSDGQILFDQDGNHGRFFPISLNTLTLADGWHSLAVKSVGPDGEPSKCDYCKGEMNFPAGVSKIWFYVENGSGGDLPSAPVITSFSPTSGGAGTQITIEGSGFRGTSEVAFNGEPAAFSEKSDGRIIATVPDAATTGKIRVTTPNGFGTSAADFEVTRSAGTRAPVVDSFAPKTGPAGTAVTIQGKNFNDATAVLFNNHPAAGFSIVSDSRIFAVVSDDATTGRVSVVNSDGTGSSQDNFIVVADESFVTLKFEALADACVNASSPAGSVGNNGKQDKVVINRTPVNCLQRSCSSQFLHLHPPFPIFSHPKTETPHLIYPDGGMNEAASIRVPCYANNRGTFRLTSLGAVRRPTNDR